ncbi:MAG TPA: hypothetical protein VF427_06980 [Noviherbaspirillum sp.]
MKKITPAHTALIALAALYALGGCTPVSPRLDSTFGNSVRTLQALQTVNPGASANPDNPPFDGTAAHEAIGRYTSSYNTPPAHRSFGIGTGQTR